MKHTSSQSGVTLLLTVMILAGITLISLAIGAFVIQEIRASRAFLLSQPAITAAEAVSEAGVWAIKRGTNIGFAGTTNINMPIPDCTNPSLSLTLTNGSFVNVCKSYDGATFSLKGGKDLTFYLFDPNDINGDYDLLGFPYTSLTVVNKGSNFSVNVNIVRLDGTPVGGQPVIVSPGSTQNISIPSVASGSEGRMKVTLSSIGDAIVDVTTNQGMPNFPTVYSTACNTKGSSCTAGQEVFTRKIKVLVPK